MADVLTALSVPPGEAASPEEAEGGDIPSLVWEEVAARIAATLAQTSLADFIARADSVGIARAAVAAAPPPMYFI